MAATATIPAPVGGLNRIDAAGQMAATDAVLLYNMIAAEYGVRSRLGYHEWVTGMTGVLDNTVKSVLPFKGSKANGSTDKLFATTDSGIWDVSASTQAPSAPAGVTAFSTNTADAGWGNAITAVDAGGNHNLIYTDEANGYYVYREATTDWLQPTLGGGATQVSNVDPATLVQCCLFAHRLWFVQKDTTKAWYLGAFGSPAIYGAATAFDFGPNFRAGGSLVGLYSWTIDGGSGIISRLVAISSGGDVVIYQGTDPSSINSWALVGTWNVGGIPAGRRVATEFGGDLLILSTVGVIPLSKLVIGNPVVDRTQYATGKIANLFNALMYSSSNTRGWSLRLHPQDNTLIITIPSTAGAATTQLAMALATRTWSQYRSLPMYSNEVWNGQLYFGTTDGRLCQHTDYVDGVLLSNVNAFTPVDCSVLTAFQNLGNANRKRLQWIRPKYLAQGAAPNVNATAKYNYDLSEGNAPTAVTSVPGSAWDASTWDSGIWGGDYNEYGPVFGAAGVGTDVAVAVRFSAVSRTVLVGIDVGFDAGGPL